MNEYSRESNIRWLIKSHQEDIANQDGTEAAALKATAARLRIRELEEELAAVQAEALCDTREAALAQRATQMAKQLQTPADPRRIELDRRVREHAQRTGDTYVDAANKLLERGELDA